MGFENEPIHESQMICVVARKVLIRAHRKGQSFNGNVSMESSFSTPYHDVTERARERLRQSPHLSVRSVSCEFDRGVLRLRGRLSSFYHKQLAQEAVARLSGVREVVNEVAVVAR